MPVPPRAVTISAVSSIVSGRFPLAGLPRTLRPLQYTIAPASPSEQAMPRPAPRVAPATTATFPSSDFIQIPLSRSCPAYDLKPRCNPQNCLCVTWCLGVFVAPQFEHQHIVRNRATKPRSLQDSQSLVCLIEVYLPNLTTPVIFL